MRRTTLIAASIVSVLVIGYGGWLSSASSGAVTPAALVAATAPARPTSPTAARTARTEASPARPPRTELPITGNQT